MKVVRRYGSPFYLTIYYVVITFIAGLIFELRRPDIIGIGTFTLVFFSNAFILMKFNDAWRFLRWKLKDVIEIGLREDKGKAPEFFKGDMNWDYSYFDKALKVLHIGLLLELKDSGKLNAMDDEDRKKITALAIRIVKYVRTT